MWIAYKYVAAAVMLAEANRCADSLKLPIALPIDKAYLQVCYVSRPNLCRCCGRLDTVEYSFAFEQRLQYIHKIPGSGNSQLSRQRRPDSRSASLISTNQAYELATNWLQAISVDVHELERTNVLDIWRHAIWDNRGRQKGLEPYFQLEWGPEEKPKVEISIDGRTKQFRYIRLEDTSFSHRPNLLSKDIDELLKISDEDFLKMSEAEREQLVQRFAVVPYLPANHQPGAKIVGSTNKVSIGNQQH